MHIAQYRYRRTPLPARLAYIFQCIFLGDYCASRLRTPGENLFSLVGLTVIPGFEFDDFDMPTEEHMLKHYPQHSEVIKRHTR